MSSASEIIGIIFSTMLILWFMASVLAQFPRIATLLRRWDVCSALPSWNFFAPRPNITDYHLLFRYQFTNSQMSGWTEIVLMQPRQLSDAVWNPLRREKKALFDIVSGIITLLGKPSATALPVSLPYLSLLDYGSSLPRPAAASGIQFMVMVSYGQSSDKEPEVIYSSEVHRL